MRREHVLPADDERGMTLPELLITIVLMGMVVVPIATALQLALQVPQSAGGRTQAATAHELLITQWTDDVGSASIVKRWTDTNHTALYAPGDPQTSACPGSAVLGSPKVDPVVSLEWTDTTRGAGVRVSADYQLRYTGYTSATTKVDLERTTSGFASSNDSQVVLSGYCVPGQEVLTEFDDNAGVDPQNQWYGSRRERARFHLSDSPTDAPRYVNLEAAARPSCVNVEPPDGPGGGNVQPVPEGGC